MVKWSVLIVVQNITQTIIIVIFCECAIVFSMLSVVGFASPKLFITTHTLSTHITSHTLYNKYKLLKVVFAQLFLKVYNNILSIVKCELMIMSASC